MATLHVRIDDATKKKVQKILDELGLDMSTAVNMYFHQIALQQGIPFEISKERVVPGHIMRGVGKGSARSFGEWKELCNS